MVEEQRMLDDTKIMDIDNDGDHDLLQEHLLRSRAGTSLLINLVSVMEKMDEQIVPAVSRWLGCAFGATPAEIGAITFWRALVQAVSSPLGGVLGHYYSRIRVVFAGCMIWGTFTLLFSSSRSIHQGSAYWAFNGIGLALIIPSTQSLTADYYPADSRGSAFGALQLTGALGGMLGSLYATSIGDATVAGIPGWRFAFISVGLVSIVVGAATLVWGVDPLARSAHSEGKEGVQRISSGSRRDVSDAMSMHSALQQQQLMKGQGSGAFLGTWFGNAFRHRAGKHTDNGFAPLDESPVPLSSVCSAAVPHLEHDQLLAGAPNSHHPYGANASTPTSIPRHAVSRGKMHAKNSTSGGNKPQSTMLQEAWMLVTLPSFIIIILQGIVGSTPWNALVFLTLYLQLLGMSDATAGSLLALFIFGTAVGSLLGGWLGDRVGRRFPNHGRIFLAQFSVAMGIPFTILLLKGLPLNGDPGTVYLYAAVLFTQGALISWTTPCCNSPVFADIVPVHLRNMIYGFDRGFEGSISALGAPLVGLFAQRYFGFEGNASTTGCDTKGGVPVGPNAGSGGRILLPVGGAVSAAEMAANHGKAVALGNAMLLWMVGPWTLCALAYSGLHWTYPRDKRRALALMHAAEAGRDGAVQMGCKE